MNTTSLRLLLPEPLWLEPEHFEQANAASCQFGSEPQQWQAYLNTLGRLSFADWLQEKLPDARIRPINSAVVAASYFNVDGFKLCLIATEHVLDDAIALPKTVIDQPANAAHCYVALEVLEDQEQAEIRGFIRYDELTEKLQQLAPSQSSEYRLPLSFLDAEINHLMGYVQHSHPSLIPLPTLATQPAEVATSSPMTELMAEGAELTTRLSQWLQGTLTEGWQTLDRLINPEANLAWSSRSGDAETSEIRGGKLVNLGMQLDRHPIALLVTVVPENEKVNVNIQALPTGEDLFLPPGLKVALVSSTDKVLQEVVSRERDNYIQLRSFKGRAGIHFRIEVTLDDVKVSEAFEL